MLACAYELTPTTMLDPQELEDEATRTEEEAGDKADGLRDAAGMERDAEERADEARGEAG